MSYSKTDVCAIICTLNAEDTIARVVASAKASGVQDVMVVDGSSTDRTALLAEKAGARVVFDPGNGLGAARALGARENHLPLTFFVGPDNIVSNQLLERLLDGLNQSDEIVACGCLTKLESTDYVSRAVTIVLQTLARPGFAATLGTPTLIQSSILRRFPYDPSRRFSDDTELFERIERLTGSQFWVADYEVLEIGTGTLVHALKRWSYYGVSDFENFEAWKMQWSTRRKLRSILHPVRKQIIEPWSDLGPVAWLYFAPILILLTFARYRGWLGQIIKSKSSRAL